MQRIILGLDRPSELAECHVAVRHERLALFITFLESENLRVSLVVLAISSTHVSEIQDS